jgi:hypothetical protein
VQFLRLFRLSAGPCRDLALSPYLARLLGLELIDHSLGDAGALALAGCPRLAGLRVLVLRGPLRGSFGPPPTRPLVGDAGALALAASPYLAGLTLLDLRDNAVSAETARALRQRLGDRVCV